VSVLTGSTPLDHTIVLGEAHLRRLLISYASYYNEIRTHRALQKDAPINRPIERIGILKSTPISRRTSLPICPNLIFGTHRINLVDSAADILGVRSLDERAAKYAAEEPRRKSSRKVQCAAKLDFLSHARIRPMI
jgi:hypothetical protein